jgi:hypothetical protein
MIFVQFALVKAFPCVLAGLTALVLVGLTQPDSFSTQYLIERRFDTVAHHLRLPMSFNGLNVSTSLLIQILAYLAVNYHKIQPHSTLIGLSANNLLF